MKRIFAVLAVAALMAVMLVAMAAPAFASNGHVEPPQPGQHGGGPPDYTSGPRGGSAVYPETQGGTCVYHYGGGYTNPDHASQSDTFGKETGAPGAAVANH